MANDKKWVNNITANEIVAAAQAAVASNKNNKSIQQMLDLVSGVQAYSPMDHSRQGVIKKIFDSESSRFRSGRGYITSNLTVSMDDVISTFWEHVFKYLGRAKSTGDTVPVRVVVGQDATDSNTLNGLTFKNRQTNCNPIHYLRKAGIMGVRNLINNSYRKGLTQVCDDCGKSSTASKVEINNTECPKCNGADIVVCWPDGNSSYGAKKQNKCQTCSYTWNRNFVYACQTCKSYNIRIESLHDDSDDSLDSILSEQPGVDKTLSDIQMTNELRILLKKIYDYLPQDPQNPGRESKTKEIFNILVSPFVSNPSKLTLDICSTCVNSATKICSKECGQSSCVHELIPNPKTTCGSQTFDISRCINFSKKIGEHYGVSASLTARRVKNIRSYFVKYVKSHKDDDVCSTLYSLLGKYV